MCGIAGIFAYREGAEPVDREELIRIRDHMARRGPDGSGLWLSRDGRLGLAHRRLAIIDLTEAAAQPMASAAGRLRITFNGEIYNYRDLRRELEAEGIVFRTTSDTEVLLRLYESRGAGMLQSLRGMYAFAIWDEGDRTLFLARDPFGIKPLYYADDGSTLRFASQVKALVAGGAVDRDHEPAGQVGFLTWGFVPEPYTLYRAIRALPAGTHALFRDGASPRFTRFFEPREEFARAEALALAGRTHGIEDVVEALEDSVRAHMVADVPVASFLSAGMDSSTMAALATRCGVELRTLTLGFREFEATDNDETRLAKTVAARLGTRHETRWITATDFDQDVEAILAAMDQPSTDGVNTYFVSKAAAATGMKVALSGIGADEILGGYPSFRDVPRIRQVVTATTVSTSLGAAIRRGIAPLLRKLTSPKYASLLEFGQDNAGAYLLRRGLYMPWELPAIMEPEVAATGWEELNCLNVLRNDVRGLSRDRSIVSALELAWYMRNQLLRDSDWAGMAHSLEIRVPYVDVVFLRRVLPSLLRPGPAGKLDLAERLVPPLPAEILHRRKTGFLVPVQQWCTALSDGYGTARGLRGWARIVLARQTAGKLQSKWPSARADAGHPLPPWRVPASKRLAALAAAISYRVVNAALSASAVVLWPRKRPRQAQRICVFRIGNIGDVVCALPAIRRVRDAYPEAHITLLTSPGHKGMPGAAEVLQHAGWIDALRVYHTDDIDTHAKRHRLLQELRGCRFDVWLDLPNNLATVGRQFRDMMFARMTGARWARGWRIDTLRWAAQAQSECLHFPNEVERTLAIVNQAGFPEGEIEFGLPRPRDLVTRVDELLSAAVPGSRQLIAIAPGAKRSTNLWMPERFAAVGLELVAQGYRVLLLGGASEAKACERIASAIGAGAESFAGQLSLPESCEVLRRCNLVVCVDSGVQHLAAAVGTPVLSLFSFWQMLGKWRPYGERNVVIQKWVDCHTCLLDECPRENLCMSRISVDEVLEALRSSLSKPPSPDAHADRVAACKQ